LHPLFHNRAIPLPERRQGTANRVRDPISPFPNPLHRFSGIRRNLNILFFMAPPTGIQSGGDGL
jgi:hypothetical protein